MLMRLRSRLDVFFRLFVKRPLATERAKIVGCTLVLGLTSRGSRINIHAADQVSYGVCHRFLLLRWAGNVRPLKHKALFVN